MTERLTADTIAAIQARLDATKTKTVSTDVMVEFHTHCREDVDALLRECEVLTGELHNSRAESAHLAKGSECLRSQLEMLKAVNGELRQELDQANRAIELATRLAEAAQPEWARPRSHIKREE